MPLNRKQFGQGLFRLLCVNKRDLLFSEVHSFLVYSRRTEIKAISLKDHAERMIPVMGLRNAIGVDFDFSEDRIYWSDVSDDSISRIFVNGTGFEKIIKRG